MTEGACWARSTSGSAGRCSAPATSADLTPPELLTRALAACPKGALEVRGASFVGQLAECLLAGPDGEDDHPVAVGRRSRHPVVVGRLGEPLVWSP